jgi:integrase
MTNEPDKAAQPEAEPKKPPEPRRPGGKTKRGPNKWLLRIFRGYDASNRRIYYSEIFHGGSRDADKRLTELHNRHKAGLPLKFQPKTFRDFFNEWLVEIDDGKRREATVAQYKQMGEAYLIPAFGKFTLGDITDVAITRLYRDLRKQDFSPYTIRMVHAILSMVFSQAEADGLLLHNPMRKKKVRDQKPEKPKPRPVAMAAGETQAFLTAASSRPEGYMFALAFYLGARPCEYLGLKWGDVDLKAQRVTIQRSLKWRRGGEWYTTAPKTEKSVRTIPLTPAIVKGLDDHRRRQLEMRMKAGANWTDHGFVFTDEVGEPLKWWWVTRVYKRILVDAKLASTFKLKVSRHSCASALLNAGIPLKMVSDRLDFGNL